MKHVEGSVWVGSLRMSVEWDALTPRPFSMCPWTPSSPGCLESHGRQQSAMTGDSKTEKDVEE